MHKRISKSIDQRYDNQGFSILEVVIGMSILAIGILAVTAMQLLSMDIRMAGLDPMGTAGSGFMETAATAVDFIADLDYDGELTAGNDERIRYYLDGTRLMQKLDDDDASIQVLLDDVTALNFTYLDDDDEPLTDNPSDPASIVITMSVRQVAGRQGTITRTLTERIGIRNG